MVTDTSILVDLVLVLALMLSLALVYVLGQSKLEPDTLEIKGEPSKLSQLIYPSRLIRQGGMMPANLLLFYWPIKLLLLFLVPLLVVEMFPQVPLWLLIPGAISGFFTPDLFLLQRRSERRQRIQGALSFFVDLMTAYLQSGISLGRAFEQAGRLGFEEKHPLAQEIKLVSRELEAGEAFHVAFHRLYLRTGLKEIERLSAVLDVGLRAGAPVTETLLRQAAVFREKQLELNKKLINQKSIMLLFAMMLVSLPMFGTIVLFPASIKISEVFDMIKALL